MCTIRVPNTAIRKLWKSDNSSVSLHVKKHNANHEREEIEDTKGVIQICESKKNRQHINGKRKKKGKQLFVLLDL